MRNNTNFFTLMLGSIVMTHASLALGDPQRVPKNLRLPCDTFEGTKRVSTSSTLWVGRTESCKALETCVIDNQCDSEAFAKLAHDAQLSCRMAVRYRRKADKMSGVPALSLWSEDKRRVRAYWKAVAPEEECGPEVCDEETLKADGGGDCWTEWGDTVTLATGIPVGAVRFDGSLGFVDRVAPIELALNFAQYLSMNSATRNVSRFVWWRVGLGVTFSKPQNEEAVVFGAYLTPWGMRFNDFNLGLGIAYQAQGRVENNNENWSVVLPFGFTLADL